MDGDKFGFKAMQQVKGYENRKSDFLYQIQPVFHAIPPSLLKIKNEKAVPSPETGEPPGTSLDANKLSRITLDNTGANYLS